MDSTMAAKACDPQAVVDGGIIGGSEDALEEPEDSLDSTMADKALDPQAVVNGGISGSEAALTEPEDALWDEVCALMQIEGDECESSGVLNVESAFETMQAVDLTPAPKPPAYACEMAELLMSGTKTPAVNSLAPKRKRKAEKEAKKLAKKAGSGKKKKKLLQKANAAKKPKKPKKAKKERKANGPKKAEKAAGLYTIDDVPEEAHPNYLLKTGAKNYTIKSQSGAQVTVRISKGAFYILCCQGGALPKVGLQRTVSFGKFGSVEACWEHTKAASGW